MPAVYIDPAVYFVLCRAEHNGFTGRESLVRLGLKTSKRMTYAAPLAKAYAGEFKRFSPG